MRPTLIVAGSLMMVYALAGAAADLGGKAGGVVVFLIAVLVAHDAIWLPLVLLAGTLLNRLVPARHRGPVRVAAIVAAALTAAALPLTLGLGRTPGNPSALPLAYGRNLALVLLALALTTGMVLVSRARTAGMVVRSRKKSAIGGRRKAR